MCTLIAFHRCVPGAALVVAANRDEFHARPALGPALRETPHGAVVAPLDARAGGTWLGLGRTGLFAAVTNRRCEEPDPSRRSRGLLVMEALAAGSAEAAARAVERQDGSTYNPFNLFLADRERAFAVTCGTRMRTLPLDPGLHVVGNAPLDGPEVAKVERLRKRAERAASAAPDRLLDELSSVCSGHEGGAEPLEDACVHAGPYGTRSSTLLRLAEDDRGSALRYADGPPCTTAYGDFTPVLRELGPDAWFAREDPNSRRAS